MPILKTSLKKNDLEERKLVKVDINSKSIVLTNISGKFYAMDAVCSHEGGPLEEGTLENYTLTCPWHYGKYDIRTAKAFAETDWVTDMKSYPVIVDDRSGEVSLDTGQRFSRCQYEHKMTEHQQDAVNESIPARPQKMQLKLLEQELHTGPDVVSFKFARRREDNNQNQKDHHYYLNYKGGQYAIVDLETKEDPEGPLRSFIIASSPTEEDFILISTRIRDTPFKQKLSSLDIGTSLDTTAPLGLFVCS